MSTDCISLLLFDWSSKTNKSFTTIFQTRIYREFLRRIIDFDYSIDYEEYFQMINELPNSPTCRFLLEKSSHIKLQNKKIKTSVGKRSLIIIKICYLFKQSERISFQINNKAKEVLDDIYSKNFTRWTRGSERYVLQTLLVKISV